MGSRIACHFAGIGVSVLLLDLLSPDASDTSSKSVRNSMVDKALSKAIQSNPSPIFTKEAIGRITTGNFQDDLHLIGSCDWILEVVAERLEVKQELFEKVEQFRKPGTLVTTNTSGIPINLMTKGRSEDFNKHFCGVHFFNPPRYLRLLEIIPTVHTSSEVIDFLMHYGDLHLGKTTILCKDTPAFIANRIGVFAFFSVLDAMEKLKLTIDDVDTLTGNVIGRSKSATFRTVDMVGLDTMIQVAKGLYQFCPNDEARSQFKIPEWLQQMAGKNWLGDKSGQGFYKKVPNAKGGNEILTLDPSSMEYHPRTKNRFPVLDAVKNEEDLKVRIKILCEAQEQAGEFYRQFHYALFSYVSNRIPELTNRIHSIDQALVAGFGWEIGAYETWDLLGVESCVTGMKQAGFKVAAWVEEMLAAGHNTFYKFEKGSRLSYVPDSGTYEPISKAGQEKAFVVMRNFEGQTVWKNSAARTYHLGDDVLGLEWYSKMGSMGGEVIEGLNTGIALAEKKFKGLVIANEGQNFSAGANLGMVYMMGAEKKFEELDHAIRMFQQTMMRARYSNVPVVIAPHGLALGGATELSLHADKVVAAAETYMGLVELGVGLIPGGGGTKEFVMRAMDEMHPEEPETITLKNRFMTIATAKVSTSAHEAFDMGVLRKGQDGFVMNPARRISEAMRSVVDMYDHGYALPQKRKNIKVYGRSALGMLTAGIHAMELGGYASPYDAFVARKLAYVMCGGDLSEPTDVSENYLLDLEREVFLSLCGETKTQERILSVLKGGKPIRN